MATSKIRELILKVTAATNSDDQAVTEAIVKVLEHAQQHGDVTELTFFHEAIKAPSKRRALIAMVKAHSPAFFDSKKLCFKLKKERKAEDWKIAEAASVESYMLFKPAPKGTPKAKGGTQLVRALMAVCKRCMDDDEGKWTNAAKAIAKKWHTELAKTLMSSAEAQREIDNLKAELEKARAALADKAEAA